MKTKRVDQRVNIRRIKFMLAAINLLFVLPLKAGAEIVETTLQIPVQIARPNQPDLRQQIVVTVVRDDANPHGRLVLIAHGRPVTAPERLRMGQVKYPGNALWLAQHGYVVVVPTRVGYGSSGGPDLDASGDCLNKDYLNALSGALSQYRQVLAYMVRQPYIDPGPGIMIGESFGGLVALAIAAEPAMGLDRIVNMAGGDGGDYSHLEQPCSPERLASSFAALGRKNRLPTLWMYSLNDRFWGARYPHQWFGAFTGAGGRAEFVQLPADKNNGHFIFNRNGLAWHAELERFMLTVTGNAATVRPRHQW